MKTSWIKESEIDRKWYVLDASGLILGRLATKVASLLIGKGKINFVPNMDNGDYVIVVNSEKFSVTGKKMSDKKYYRHSGYPGGFKERSLEEMLKSGKSEEVIRKAVVNMLPKTKLRAGRMARLFVYDSANHPHEAQKPIEVKLS